MIREATQDDIAAIVRMAGEFATVAKFSMGFDADDTASFVQSLIYDVDRTIIVAVDKDSKIVGMIAGALSPWMLNFSSTMATELAWWVDEKSRGTTVGPRLLKEFIKWAKNYGAITISISHMKGVGSEDKMVGMYKRLGFIPREVAHVMEVS